MAMDLDVIVDADTPALPVGIGIPRGPGSALSAGWSMVSNACRRQPGSFLKARVLRRASSSRMARFSSSRLKQRWFRSAAMIQRLATSTPPSTLALSLGFLTRAGMTATP